MALLRVRVPEATHVAREAAAAEISVDVTEPVVDTPEESTDPGVARREVAMAHGATARRAMDVTAPSSEAAAVREDAPSAEPASTWSFDPLAARGAVNLGVGSHWQSVVASGGAADGGRAEEERSKADVDTSKGAERSLRDELAARDVSLGLGRAGPLVSAAHAAASSAGAPAIGAVILEVETDASGTVLSARADNRAWDSVARELVRGMAGRPLRVPPGARGLRARLRVVAQRTVPSGGQRERSLGAVPEDACAGKGITRKCVSGMPAGVAGSYDISDLGARPSRVVHVQLLGETAI